MCKDETNGMPPGLAGAFYGFVVTRAIFNITCAMHMENNLLMCSFRGYINLYNISTVLRLLIEEFTSL